MCPWSRGETRQKIIDEQGRVDNLVEQVKAWEVAQQLRNYVQAARGAGYYAQAAITDERDLVQRGLGPGQSTGSNALQSAIGAGLQGPVHLVLMISLLFPCSRFRRLSTEHKE